MVAREVTRKGDLPDDVRRTPALVDRARGSVERSAALGGIEDREPVQVQGFPGAGGMP